MDHVFRISPKKYHRAILALYNFNLKLSELELDIVSTMLANDMLEINPETKEYLRVTLDKDKYATNNYIKRLKDKGILLPNQDGKGYTLNPNIVNLTRDNKVSFEFIIA